MDNDVDDTSAGSMACVRPVAKDMLDPPGTRSATAEIVRNLLENRSYDELMDRYGLRPEEASTSLNLADIASLPAWNEEIIFEVAGVAGPEEFAALRRCESNAKRDVDREMWSNQIAVKMQATWRITRRIKLAMQAEAPREVLSPAEGVLLLRRAGIEVAPELLDAVAAFVLRDDSDDSALMFRELKKTPVIQSPLPDGQLFEDPVELDQSVATPKREHDLAVAASAKTRTHKLRNNESAILAAEINQAKERTQFPQSATSVWDELTKLAEKKLGPMIGFSSDGIQYRGKKYQATQEPDVFTLKNLRDRLKRAETR